MDSVIDKVTDVLQREGVIQVEVSARHVHLCESSLRILFGEGAALTPKRPLSQTGQYLAEERVNLIGPGGRKDRVAILGPLRGETQVELSRSDCIAMGVEAPVRQSGDTKGSGAVTIEGPKGRLAIKEGVIIAQNHIHMTPETAQALKLTDRQHVKVSVFSERPLIYSDVLIRVHESFRTRMHIDFDEANAAMVSGFTLGRIIR